MHTNKSSNVIIYGNDENHSNWFHKETLANTTGAILNRNKIPISATILQNAMLTDHKNYGLTAPTLNCTSILIDLKQN